MPSQVRIISGPRNKSFDHYVRDALTRMEQEHSYFGITDQDRARFIRNKLVTAGKHIRQELEDAGEEGVTVKAFWRECQGCANGGPDCRYHVLYTLYPLEKARAYRERINHSR